MVEEKNIDKLLEKVNGGFVTLGSSEDTNYIITVLLDVTHELADGIIEAKEIGILCSYINNLDMPSAIRFLKDKMHGIDALAPEFEKLKKLLIYYSIIDKNVKK